MADAIFIATICAFFALCVVYIRWCDRIIGTDDAVEPAVEALGSDSAANTSTTTTVGAGVTV